MSDATGVEICVAIVVLALTLGIAAMIEWFIEGSRR